MKQVVKKSRDQLEEVLNFSLSKEFRSLFILLIITIAFFLRIWNISSPILDRTQWKEIDYIMISENYYLHGYKFHQPEISWLAEDTTVTAMELPLVPYFAAILYKLFGVNEYSVRFITLISFLLAAFFIYKLARTELGDIAGLLSLLVFAVISQFSTFSHWLFTEPTLLLCVILTLYFLSIWSKLNLNKHLVGALIFFSISVALKPTALYMAIPIAYILFKKYRFNVKSYLKIIPWFLISLIIPITWYAYAYYLSQNSIDVFGVFGGQFGGHDKFQTIEMLTTKSWYRTMFSRLYDLLGGIPGLSLVFLGLIASFVFKKGYLFIFYLVAVGFFFIIVAEGNIDAEYRQMTIWPPASILISLGLLSSLLIIRNSILSIASRGPEIRPIRFFYLALALLLVLFPVLNLKKITPEPPGIPYYDSKWELAQNIKEHTEPSDPIILIGEYTIHKGGNDLSPVVYYYSDRKGWTLQQDELNMQKVRILKNRGAKVLAAVYYNREEVTQHFVEVLKKEYPVLYDNPKAFTILFSLKKDQ